MTVRVGVNGFGRIGRNFWRAVDSLDHDIEIVAVNDLTDTKTLAHLLKYDSDPGQAALRGHAPATGSSPSTARTSRCCPSAIPAALPWGDLGVDIVIESTGFFTKADAAPASTSTAGAKKVIISAPATGEDLTVVVGVNDDKYDGIADDPVQRVLHHQLRGADGQGAARELRPRPGPDDHDPRLHQRPGHPGLPAQGPASGPGRGASTSSRPPPVPPRRPPWCCRSSRASCTATRCGCRCRPVRSPT